MKLAELSLKMLRKDRKKNITVFILSVLMFISLLFFVPQYVSLEKYRSTVDQNDILRRSLQLYGEQSINEIPYNKHIIDVTDSAALYYAGYFSVEGSDGYVILNGTDSLKGTTGLTSDGTLPSSGSIVIPERFVTDGFSVDGKSLIGREIIYKVSGFNKNSDGRTRFFTGDELSFTVAGTYPSSDILKKDNEVFVLFDDLLSLYILENGETDGYSGKIIVLDNPSADDEVIDFLSDSGIYASKSVVDNSVLHTIVYAVFITVTVLTFCCDVSNMFITIYKNVNEERPVMTLYNALGFRRCQIIHIFSLKYIIITLSAFFTAAVISFLLHLSTYEDSFQNMGRYVFSPEAFPLCLTGTLIFAVILPVIVTVAVYFLVVDSDFLCMIGEDGQ